ncbi:hypothetical protein FACS1894199_18500 [Bacteroidia bacterium]|nr:hypothetical protein FACS1894199_18500 [Bacteroidia bacterium]
MSKFCSSCGAQVADEAVVCIKCGCAVTGKTATNLSGQQPPKTWLIQSILVTLFCCLPFGIVGIVNASKVETRFYAGDIDEANRLAAQAAKWTKLGFWIGLGVIILYFFFMTFVIGAGIFAGLSGVGGH